MNSFILYPNSHSIQRFQPVWKRDVLVPQIGRLFYYNKRVLKYAYATQ